MDKNYYIEDIESLALWLERRGIYIAAKEIRGYGVYIKELEKDAKRYKYLKEQKLIFSWDTEYHEPYATVRSIGDRNVPGHFNGDVDAALDAVIKENKDGSN